MICSSADAGRGSLCLRNNKRADRKKKLLERMPKRSEEDDRVIPLH